jgi:dTDP-4-dehydrorhamnose reductase
VRLLVLGAGGMVGHQLVESWRGRHDVHAAYHRGATAYPVVAPSASFDVDATDAAQLRALIAKLRPDAVINAVGAIKQRPEAADPAIAIAANALLPHVAAAACASAGARLVQFSTDCVFSGRAGNYAETAVADADDLYGRSKLLGEVVRPHAITLRTSMIGLELQNGVGLVEWFLAQTRPIRGFRRAIFTGFTTLELARVVERVLVEQPALHGVFHVASAPIDKHALLVGLRDRLGRAIAIEPDDDFRCDRSLDGSAFRAATGYAAPAWPVMLDELAAQIRERRR